MFSGMETKVESKPEATEAPATDPLSMFAGMNVSDKPDDEPKVEEEYTPPTL